MECYEGVTMIKTFRGLIVNGTQDTILLHTTDGSVGYRIVKFQVMQTDPGSTSVEHTVKIYKTFQTTIDNAIDFSNQVLLGVALWQKQENVAYPVMDSVIFDQEIFNQDIYITQASPAGEGGSTACNYYLELEQVSLDINQNTTATLKDIRNQALTTV